MIYILLFALSLRFINLDQSLWLDEAIQYKASYFYSIKELFSVFLPGDFNPPLQYLVNHFLGQLIGFSETALRMPSVIFGVLTVWLLYKLGGKWPALLLATSGLHIYYSQEARGYSLAALAVTASFWALKNKKWFIYVLASIAAVYSHYLTWFIFPAQWLWLPKKDRRKLLLSWAAIGIAYLPWLPIFWQQLAAGKAVGGTAWGNVIGGVSLKNVLLIPVKFLVGRVSIDNNYIFALFLVLPLLATFWALRRGIKKNRLAAVWLFVPMALIIIVSLFVPVLSYFRLLFLLPAFYLLIAAGAPKLLLPVWLVFNLITSGIYLYNPVFHRENWRGVARIVTRVDQPVVIIAAVDAPLKYYLAGGNIQTTDTIPDENFWYVAYAEDIFDPSRAFRQAVKDAGFSESESFSFLGQITLIEYRQ